MIDIKITFEDGSSKAFPKSSTYKEVAETFEDHEQYIGVMADNKIVSFSDFIEQDQTVSFLRADTSNGNRIYCAGLKMIFEYAVKKTFPSISVEYAYSLPRGVVAVLGSEQRLTNEDISSIRENMAQIIADDMRIEKLIVKNVDGINYYKKLNNRVKAGNIHSIMDNTVVLYRLDNILNYYYSEMPYSTGYINKYEIRYLGNNKVVISYPTDFDNGVTPDYVNYKGIIEAYEKGMAWLDTMHVPYIYDINREINTGKISNFIKSSELNFNLEINETAKIIAENPDIKYVMIAGPSSSGKTTVTKRLANYLELYGKGTIVISIDDYFKERENSPKDASGENDYECLEATDMDYLASDIKKLMNGEAIHLPKFNFITGHKELSGKPVQVKENTIVLFEGLHAINDQTFPMIADNNKFKIYVSPYIPLCLDEHNYISLNDLRLLRRMVRDFRTRGAEVEDTLGYWRKVRLGEEKYIIPFVHSADKIINTSLPYEVGALKVMAEPLLYSVPIDSKYYNEARRMLNFLKQFFPINTEYVPGDSIIREFIGGNND